VRRCVDSALLELKERGSVVAACMPSRQLMAVLSVAFALEGGLYSAVTPIVPLLTRRFDLSEATSALLLSNYSAGIILGSLLCVAFVATFNARAAAAAGLVILAIATVVFAWTANDVALLGARFMGGLGGGVTWTACVAWLLSVWPAERRGEALGRAMGPAVVGTVAGPLVGTLALQVGVRWPFTVVAAVCLTTSLWVLRIPRPDTHVTDTAEMTSRRSVNKLVVLGAAVATLAGVAIGAVNLAGPLVLTRTGAHDFVGGASFVVAALVTIALARPIGRLVDRVGATATTGVALTLLATTMPLLAPSLGPGPIAIMIVLLVAATNALYIAASTMLTHGAQRAGWSIYFATALVGTLWGTGETIGALLTGVGFEHFGVGRTVVAGALLMALGLATVLAARTRAAGRGARVADSSHEHSQPHADSVEQ
jgi:predicted MFS family arabinose efflux permease